jgi:hypothetical protein
LYWALQIADREGSQAAGLVDPLALDYAEQAIHRNRSSADPVISLSDFVQASTN